ncbi:MAG: electron transfer flavoprotein subunit alpha/FixB family protein [Desulfobacterales bacterium]|nr:MAG: electron transfer flavoprotein subunit alpha/FixB family protein [Desulfobacterales bacterium]
MEKVGILIEVKADQIKKANYGVITAARGRDRQLYAFLLDGGRADHKLTLGRYGIHKIIEIAGQEGPLEWNPATWAQAVIEAMEYFGIRTLLGLTSSQGKDLLPRIAARLDAPLVMDCIHLNLAEHTVRKPQYSGKTIATLKVQGGHCIYGVRPNAIAAQPAPCEAETVIYRTAPAPAGLTVKAIKQAMSAGVDLSEAEIIIAGGRGMENGENFKILFECAALMGAAVGASRAAVDADWVPYAMQVGQTGVTVSPKVYIACGISGSVQHFAGMKTAGLIVAINQDLTAAIIGKCDYAIVADLFEIVPRLTRKLQALDGRI